MVLCTIVLALIRAAKTGGDLFSDGGGMDQARLLATDTFWLLQLEAAPVVPPFAMHRVAGNCSIIKFCSPYAARRHKRHLADHITAFSSSQQQGSDRYHGVVVLCGGN